MNRSLPGSASKRVFAAPIDSFRARSVSEGISLLLTCLWVLGGRPVLHAEEPVVSRPRADVLLVTGSAGTPEYGRQFSEWGEKWQAAATAGQANLIRIQGEESQELLPEIESVLNTLSEETVRPLWIVLIGHGTFDGRTARFNIPGPDLEPRHLKTWLAPVTRPVAVINCTSSGAPFLTELSQAGRVVITATNSGNEVNFARFGGYLADALNDLSADLDKDRQVSLLEAFLRASSLTEAFYTGDGRLPTEHAMLDDNGDARPVPASGFEGVRPLQRNDSGTRLPDGVRAHQWFLCPNENEASLSPEVIARRNELELQIAELRNRKATMPEDRYYAELEELLLKMAKLLLPSSTS